MGKEKKGGVNAVKNCFSQIGHSSLCTKFSMVFMGIGQIMRKQFVKGFFYLFIEIAFILYMVFFGGQYLAKLFEGHLGTVTSTEVWNEETMVYDKIVGDNSFLILLYSVVTLVIIIAFIAVWVLNVKGNLANDRRIAEGKSVNTFKQDFSALLNENFHGVLLFLPLLGLLVFTVMPLIFMILIAFTNYDYQHLPPGRLFDWVGFENFIMLFKTGNSGAMLFGTVFLRVFVWTIIWAIFATFTNYFLGMVIALMINKKGIRFKALWRTLFVVVIAVPQFVTLLLMQKILDGDGILNVVLGTNIRWLADTRWNSLIPRIVIIVVNIWIGVPYTILMCSGILMNIPSDFNEAARIDGANVVQIFFKITLPYMLHVTGPHLITQFVGNINNFNVIWLLTGGGPIDINNYAHQAQSTDLLVTWLYRLTTDTNPQYNFASVIGIIIFIISASLSLLTYSKSSSAKNEEDYQ
ncbi:MAG: sugar ABC transporter permease [Clostridia bacterium]|nr:sugar ABC transporter permease [Clostridia bacterium]